MSKPVVLVKLGGSLITDKTKPYSLNCEVIGRLAGEIKESCEEGKVRLVVGHGSGSFGHVSAKKYQTSDGFINEESKYGLCVVQNDAAKLNRIVVESLLKEGVRAISFQMSSACTAKNARVKECYLNSFKRLLKCGIVPVPYGDVGTDIKNGCCILSTEEIFRHLSGELKPKKIVLVAKVDGVFTADPTKDKSAKFIREINKSNWVEVKGGLSGSDGTDVTGGMIQKVEQAIEMAKNGAEVEIINGLKGGNLKMCLLGKNVGTRIRWER
ncbi:MAG: isopentenyl phosphate kinase [Candidatus Aenigmatarchaeota archaeon]